MSHFPELVPLDPRRTPLRTAAAADEAAVVEALLAEADPGPEAARRIAAEAIRLVEEIRREHRKSGGLDAFMHEYDLSSREGVMLMCLAEALLRVPDGATADRLIADKLGAADWERHLGRSPSLFVNASTWALMLTGRLVHLGDGEEEPASMLHRLVARSGEPVIRRAMVQAMRIMGRQFVIGRTIGEALERSRDGEVRGYRHSFDMLGESAHTAADAARYRQAYQDAIAAVGQASSGRGPFAGPGVSIKLSALHPRFEFSQRARVLAELIPVVGDLAVRAKAADIGLCVDTEEADRLDITLDVVEGVFALPSLAGWEGFGLAVQAYQKRGRPLIDWLSQLALRGGRRLSVRLVKGAYWDAEIKRAQEQGLASYPVFTRKANTDISYLACARAMLQAPGAFYAQFATHNAQTLAAVRDLAGDRRDLEFQRLHGMGEELYDRVVGDGPGRVPCRVYGPVGSHEDLLAYLVRRLLENGSNTSFVNRIVDATLPTPEVVADPVTRVKHLRCQPHPRIPLPQGLYGPDRRNARGIDLADPGAVNALVAAMARAQRPWSAVPLIAGRPGPAERERPVLDPADRRRPVGAVLDVAPVSVDQAMRCAAAQAPLWAGTPVGERAACLDRLADRLEEECPELMALAVREAGKTINDALAEVREAVDFCRYYAARARADFAQPLVLPGPTGERNELSLHGRGVFVCISPWNFPLAIFTGQVAAALVAGNVVVAKPAEQTPLIAARAVRLFHEAGVPGEALSFLPGEGAVGAALVADPRTAGVAFTGSVETAHAINRSLAARSGPIVPLIAETGGQNVMIADSTALPEQVVADAIASAFRSAGQRCSALRVLFLQKEIAPRVLAMLEGAIAELRIGDPGLLSTDMGPIIDGDALAMLTDHARRMDREGDLVCRGTLDPGCAHGTFFPPTVFRIDGLDRLNREVFGPILHVVAFDGDHVDRVIDRVNGTGYGLTLGIHSRVDGFVRRVIDRARVGNTYVNRNMIGAVVGVQPFGGEGLSGTGPKAGGPHYLLRFATERTVSQNTAAAGGNAQLLSLSDTDEP
jgi:RHH-type proline utilization regulon transcriptional repressor/proline dehydrogenase/delta 1-pyrroline-5-carboxylate dehydrogenase